MPLRQGTSAVIRLASQSGFANRYVDLDLGPGTAAKIRNSGLINASNTTSTVDLDELFNSLNAQTRQGLRDVFQGSASQYAGRGKQAQLAWQYLNPSIATASVLFHELNRDTAKFTKFIVTSSNLVADLAQRQSDLSGLVSHLPPTFHRAGQPAGRARILASASAAVHASRQHVVCERSQRAARHHEADRRQPSGGAEAPALLAQFEPLAIDAVPTIRDLSNVISRPGVNNDLIKLNQLAVPLAQVTVGKVRANGALRPGAFIVSKQALKGAVPELAVARPYAVDLTGWFEGYSHPGIYDANGAVSRAGAPVVGVGSIENGAFNLFGHTAGTTC